MKSAFWHLEWTRYFFSRVVSKCRILVRFAIRCSFLDGRVSRLSGYDIFVRFALRLIGLNTQNQIYLFDFTIFWLSKVYTFPKLLLFHDALHNFECSGQSWSSNFELCGHRVMKFSNDLKKNPGRIIYDFLEYEFLESFIKIKL